MPALNVDLEEATIVKLRKTKGHKSWKDFLTEIANNKPIENKQITVEEFKELCKQTSQVLEYASQATQQDLLLKIKPIIRMNVKEVSPAIQLIAEMDQDQLREFIRSIKNSNK